MVWEKIKTAPRLIKRLGVKTEEEADKVLKEKIELRFRKVDK